MSQLHDNKCIGHIGSNTWSACKYVNVQQLSTYIFHPEQGCIYMFEEFQGLTVALPHSKSIFLICVQLINKYRDGSYLCVFSSRIQQPHGVGKPIFCTTRSLHYSRKSFWVTEWPGIFTTAIYYSLESWSCFNSLQPNTINEENSIIKISVTNFLAFVYARLTLQTEHFLPLQY